MRSIFLVTLLIAACVVAVDGASREQEREAASNSLDSHTGPIHTNLSSYFELLSTRYRFSNDGTGQKHIVAEIRIANLLGARQRSRLTFDYQPLNQQLEIVYIRIRKRDGRIEHIITNQVIKTPHILSAATLPEVDFNEHTINVPNLQPGDLLEYDVATIIRHPVAPFQFWVVHNFNPNDAVVEELEIDVPKGRSVKMATTFGPQALPVESGGMDIYYWKRQNPTPKIELTSIDSAHIAIPDVQLSSFLSWEDVGRWYSDIEKNSRTPTPDVASRAIEITRGLQTDSEKAEALYNFTARDIKSISLLSLGIGGYKPSMAGDVLKRGWGDCKDKAVLLSALLESEGLHVASVLISPDREFSPSVPSPWYFDHLIVMLRIANKEIWMDPTSAGLPMGTLDQHLCDKEALVMPPNGDPYLGSTP